MVDKSQLNVVALGEVEAYFIPKDEILKLYEENADFGMKIFKYIATELGNKNLAVANMAQKQVKARIAEALLSLERKFGIDPAGFIDMKLSRDEIAEYVGAATEDCIRRIRELGNEGAIKIISGGKIKIIKESKLDAISNGFC
jgi:CRP-like cAMP-binding protein